MFRDLVAQVAGFAQTGHHLEDESGNQDDRDRDTTDQHASRQVRSAGPKQVQNHQDQDNAKDFARGHAPHILVQSTGVQEEFTSKRVMGVPVFAPRSFSYTTPS